MKWLILCFFFYYSSVFSQELSQKNFCDCDSSFIGSLINKPLKKGGILIYKTDSLANYELDPKIKEINAKYQVNAETNVNPVLIHERIKKIKNLGLISLSYNFENNSTTPNCTFFIYIYEVKNRSQIKEGYWLDKDGNFLSIFNSSEINTKPNAQTQDRINYLLKYFK